MSARSVCKGSRPCKCHSLRAISAPLRRPETLTLMPCPPHRRVSSTALRMARRKALRFSNCAALFSACIRALHVHVRDARARKPPFHARLQLEVFQEEVAELLLRKPVRVPVLVVAEAEAVWMNFLTHNLLLRLFLSRLFGRSRFRLLLGSALRRLLLRGLFRGLLRAALTPGGL